MAPGPIQQQAMRILLKKIDKGRAVVPKADREGILDEIIETHDLDFTAKQFNRQITDAAARKLLNGQKGSVDTIWQEGSASLTPKYLKDISFDAQESTRGKGNSKSKKRQAPIDEGEEEDGPTSSDGSEDSYHPSGERRDEPEASTMAEIKRESVFAKETLKIKLARTGTTAVAAARRIPLSKSTELTEMDQVENVQDASGVGGIGGVESEMRSDVDVEGGERTNRSQSEPSAASLPTAVSGNAIRPRSLEIVAVHRSSNTDFSPPQPQDRPEEKTAGGRSTSVLSRSNMNAQPPKRSKEVQSQDPRPKRKHSALELADRRVAQRPRTEPTAKSAEQSLATTGKTQTGRGLSSAAGPVNRAPEFRFAAAASLTALSAKKVKKDLRALFGQYREVAGSLLQGLPTDQVARWCIKPSSVLLEIYKQLHGEDWKEAAKQMGQLRSLRAIELVGGCVSAAVQLWVFDKPLQWDGPEQMLPKPESLSYMGAVLRMFNRGEEHAGLRSDLRYVAWQAASNMVEDPEFQNKRIIPIAKSLATDLMLALAPQFDELGIQRSSGKEARMFWEERNEEMQQIFFDALVLKGRIAVAPQYFAFEWVPYGANMDKATMSMPRGGESGLVTWCATPTVSARNTIDGEWEVYSQATVYVRKVEQ